MADSWNHLSDPQLERVLHDLGEEIAYPLTPDLTTRVRQQLKSRSTRRSPLTRILTTRLALAVAATLLLLVGLLALVPTARTAVADRLGLPGVTIRYLPFIPTPTPTPTSTPVPTPPPTGTPIPTPQPTPTSVPIGVRLHLGERVTLAEAQARVAYRILTPTHTSLGPPDEIYLGTPPDGGQVAFIYGPRPGLPETGTTGVGLLLTEFRVDPNSSVDPVGKGLDPGSRLEMLTVNDSQAYWIEGNMHVFFYQDPSGEVQQETIRLASNVLLWRKGDLLLRIESGLAKDAVLRIAESVRSRFGREVH